VQIRVPNGLIYECNPRCGPNFSVFLHGYTNLFSYFFQKTTMSTVLRKLSYILSLMLVVSLISCGGKKTDDDPDAEPAEDNGGEVTTTKKTVDMANGATITGMVKLDGTAPASKTIKMDADPVCKTAHSTPVMEDFWVVDANGGVANTFVYVREGLGGDEYEPGSGLTLDQKGCMYHPRVSGVVAGSKVTITNSDQTLHNVHAFPSKNTSFNEGQPAGSPAKEKTEEFTKPEVMIPIKCDVHGWMKSYVGVLPHPFFAVSGADGKYTIPGVPAGEYTVTAWHETSKGDAAGVTVDQKVTVAAKESKTVDFMLKPM
jgi:plastocyanin